MEVLIAVLAIVAALLGLPLFAVFGGASMAFFGSTEHETETGLSPIYWAGNEFFTAKFADSNLTVTIPLFIFAGYLLAESGAPKRLVRLSEAFLGWLPGGLPIVCIVASAFFTTFTGGSGITIVAIGGLLMPALMSVRYEQRFSLGTAGGSLGLVFPPSVPLILYAIIAGLEITEFFKAGVLPTLITLLILGAYSIFVAARQNRPRKPFDPSEVMAATWEAKWEILLPLVIVLGLLTGFLRIHEASAFAASYALVIEVFVHKDISLTRGLPRIIRESVTMFGAILVILATAIGFTGYLVDARVPEAMIEVLGSAISDPITFLLILNVFLLLVGMLMDVFSAIVVVVPLIIPIANTLVNDQGEPLINPYHLGIVFLLNLEIGYLTPPVGLNLFISSLRFDKPVTELYRAVVPFVGLLVVALLIVTYIPWFSTVLLSEDNNPIDLSVPVEEVLPPIDLDALDDGPTEEGFSLDDLEADVGGDGFTLDDLEEDDGETLDDLEAEEGSFTLDDFEEEGGGGGAEPNDTPTLDDFERELLDQP